MRSALRWLGPIVFACIVLPCAACSGAGAQPANLAIAGGFVAAAAAMQVAQTVAEENAKRNAPVTHASVVVSPQCDNDGQYACLSVQPPASSSGSSTIDGGGLAAPEMTDDQARDYVLQFVNGVRRLNGVGRLARDGALEAFAQAGSDELAIDHRPGAHLSAHAGDVGGAGGEVQGPSEGAPAGALQDRLGDALMGFMNEGPGRAEHDALLRPEWRRLGVGVARRDGRTFLTVDFSE
jgi:uncharacterized protein YkwD